MRNLPLAGEHPADLTGEAARILAFLSAALVALADRAQIDGLTEDTLEGLATILSRLRGLCLAAFEAETATGEKEGRP